MSKPLSQQEIDALLSVQDSPDGGNEGYDLAMLGGSGSSEDDDRVQPYNFKRPRLFSQEQMRVLTYVHESFARDLSVYLSAQLRTIVEISLTAVDQVLYSEYVMSSAAPSALYVVEAQKLNHNVVFEIDPSLVIYTVEKLFGGRGEFLQSSREVSQIEQRIMSKVMERAFRELEQSWQQVNELELKEVAFESNAEFVQIIPGVEPALVATFEVWIYEQRSFLNICYPYIMLEKMLGRAGLKQYITNATSPVPPEERATFEDGLQDVNVQLRAELGRTLLPLTELLALEEGDIIPLQRRTKEAMRVLIGDSLKFKASVGKTGKHRALRILDIFENHDMPVPAHDTNDA